MAQGFVSFDRQLLDSVDAEARRQRVSRSDVIRQAVGALLEGTLEPSAPGGYGPGRPVRTYMLLPASWWDQLGEEASRRNMPRSELIRRTLRAYLSGRERVGCQ